MKSLKQYADEIRVALKSKQGHFNSEQIEIVENILEEMENEEKEESKKDIELIRKEKYRKDYEA